MFLLNTVLQETIKSCIVCVCVWGFFFFFKLKKKKLEKEEYLLMDDMFVCVYVHYMH